MRNYFALQSLRSKKGSRSGRQDAQPGQERVFLARGLGRVAHQPFEHGEIVQETAAADLGQAATCVRPVALVALGHFDETGLLQHLQVPAQIAVGQAAQLLEIRKAQALWMRHQRGQQSQPRLLVNDAVESVIGKWCAAAFSLRHLLLLTRNATAPPSAIARSRTAGPWSTATTHDPGSPTATRQSPRQNTRHRRAPPSAAASVWTRISRC